MNDVVCRDCQHRFPVLDCLWLCPDCGGVLELSDQIQFEPSRVIQEEKSLWRYRHTFPLPDTVAPVSFGEGGTPLVTTAVQGQPVHFKLDYVNPTSSFKDRGMALLVSTLAAAGVEEAAVDSSGNAGASFAAYTARAGIRGRVFVPASAASGKLSQIAVYGAELVPVPGPRSAAADAARKAVEEGVVYASHNYNPICLAGWMTTAFELWEQLGRAPDWVIVPAGYGTQLVSLALGFNILQRSGLIDRLPRLIGVQARACAPLWALQHEGEAGLAEVTEGETAAEGIRILRPLRIAAVLEAIAESEGDLLAVAEPAIADGQRALAALGYYVEATSAVVWPALEEVLSRAGEAETIAVVLTGSGLKSHKG